MGYIEGFRAGTEAGSPLDGVFGVLKESFARKTAERKKEEDDNRALRNELLKMAETEKVKSKYDIELEQEKSRLKAKEPLKETPVYLVDPITGETKQVATTPKGAKTIRGQVPTTEKIQMGTYLDSMEESIDAMEEKLKDPNIMLRGLLNPLGERDFKAILASFDKEAAIAAGGKQLTKTELDLIRSTRPTIWDIKSPEAIARKIRKLRSIVTGAKSRLGEGGGKTGQGTEQDNEYATYLKSIGQ